MRRRVILWEAIYTAFHPTYLIFILTGHATYPYEKLRIGLEPLDQALVNRLESAAPNMAIDRFLMS